MSDFTPYFSEIRYRGGASTDFIEVALDDGVDPASIQVIVYRGNGTIRSSNSLDPTPDSTIAGTDVYTVETGIHRLGAVALVVDGTVVSFVSFDKAVTASEGAASGQTSTQIGSTETGESLQSTDMGTSYTVSGSPSPGTIPCFVAGTLVDTPKGPRRVEDIAPGDLVLTHDHGPQPVIWTSGQQMRAGAAPTAEIHPIRIPAGAFGPGRPARAVLVSPAHRLLLAQPDFEMLFGAPEMLVAAKHLLGWRGIHVAHDQPAPSYHHLLLQRHEVLSTSGLPSESFYPRGEGLRALDAAARSRLFAQFTWLKYRPDLYGAPARPCLRGFEASLITAPMRAAA